MAGSGEVQASTFAVLLTAAATIEQAARAWLRAHATPEPPRVRSGQQGASWAGPIWDQTAISPLKSLCLYGCGGESACRRGSVQRSVAGVLLCGHPSVQPTRKCLRAGRSLPAWPCSGWGLPSHPGHPGCWCALTAPFHPHLCPEGPSAVCSLWHFPASRLDWPLASILPCGAPTFLSPGEPGPRPPGRLTTAPFWPAVTGFAPRNPCVVIGDGARVARIRRKWGRRRRRRWRWRRRRRRARSGY